MNLLFFPGGNCEHATSNPLARLEPYCPATYIKKFCVDTTVWDRLGDGICDRDIGGLMIESIEI